MTPQAPPRSATGDAETLMDERLRAIEQRANTGEYHCREHFGQFDADDDVLFLLAIIARLRAESRRLAGAVAELHQLTDEMNHFEGAFAAERKRAEAAEAEVIRLQQEREV